MPSVKSQVEPCIRFRQMRSRRWKQSQETAAGTRMETGKGRQAEGRVLMAGSHSEALGGCTRPASHLPQLGSLWVTHSED